MKFTRVIPVNGRLQICARDKVQYGSLYLATGQCSNDYNYVIYRKLTTFM